MSAIPQVRNRGTIGGNVAHADPASDLPTVLTALGCPLRRRRSRRASAPSPASEFFQGMMTTALGEHEILTAVEVPAKQAGQGMAYVKFVHPGIALRRHRRRGAS